MKSTNTIVANAIAGAETAKNADPIISVAVTFDIPDKNGPKPVRIILRGESEIKTFVERNGAGDYQELLKMLASKDRCSMLAKGKIEFDYATL